MKSRRFVRISGRNKAAGSPLLGVSGGDMSVIVK
jgi:hypothetical protein